MRRQAITLLLVAGALTLSGCGINVSINGGGGDSRETGSYAGTTSQGLPIAFTVTPHGGVESVRFGWRARCEDGKVHVNSILLPGAQIQNGSFEAGGRLETGGIAHVTGHFEGSKAGGVLSRSRGTAFGVNCRASGITWSADPGEPAPMPLPSSPDGGGAPPPPPPPPAGAPSSGAFSGTTSQGLPITLSVSGDYVLTVRFGWRARCEDGEIHTNTILLPGGPIRHGSFRVGGTLTTGGVAHVSGQLRRSTASGVLSRSHGSSFGVNCTATGIGWHARAGAPAPSA
jgi:hypothetical protein